MALKYVLYRNAAEIGSILNAISPFGSIPILFKIIKYISLIKKQIIYYFTKIKKKILYISGLFFQFLRQ